jgi:ketosteroid isomerase-like protein
VVAEAGGTPVEVVTAFTGSLGAGDVDSCLTMIHPELVFSEAPSLPFGGDHLGKDGFLGLLSGVAKHYRVRLAESVVAAAGDRVLVRVSGTIASRATGRSMPLEALDLYEIRDGLVARIDVYYKDSAAVTALCEPADDTGNNDKGNSD